MRIKKLELVGFKSFKDRTVIQFDTGITGIVGPNGCGKSNIVDALVWVMGEMSAKHLRGSSMEDVIFAGSQDYAPTGFAEVSLTLENDGGPFPVQYLSHSEVMVTRRLHRSGESEYLINKEPARLRDIQEIFMDTGAGSRGFSIIEQGQIGKIITSKPSERRSLIEEAAGITKFKVRKKESERKLKATEQNLIRLADIVTELKRQMESLERQAQKAERYKKIKDELTDKEMWIFSTQFGKLLTQQSELLATLEQAEDREAGFEASFAQAEAEFLQHKELVVEKQTVIEDMQFKFKDLNQKVIELEKSIRETQFEIEQARRSTEMTGSFVTQYEARFEALTEEKANIEDKFIKAQEAYDEAETFFEQSQSLFDEAFAKVQTCDQALTEKRRALISLEQNQVAIGAKKEALQEKEQEIREEKAQSQVAYDEVLTQKKEFETRRNEFFKKLESEKQLQLDMSKDLDALRSNLEIQNQQKQEASSVYESTKEELTQVSSLLMGLENLQKNMEGFDDGVKAALTQNANLGLKTIADVVDVPPQYEAAFSAVVGVKFQTLVSPNLDIRKAEEIFATIEKENQGRVGFLLQSEDIKTSATGAPHFFSLVTVDGAYESLLKGFLSRLFLVTDAVQAQAIFKEIPEALCVTETGMVYDSLGFVTGGMQADGGTSLIRRKREIKDLTDKKEVMTEKLKAAQKNLDAIVERISTIEKDIEQTREENNQKEITIAGLKKDLEQAEYELKNSENALSKYEAQLQTVDTRWQSLAQSLEALIEKESQELTQIQELKEEVDQLDEELRTTQSGIENLRQKATDSKVTYASSKEQLESIKVNLEKTSSALDEVTREIESMNLKSEQSMQVMSENELVVEKQKIELERSITEVQQIEEKISALKNEYEELAEKARESGEVVSAMTIEKGQLKSRVTEAQLQKEKVETQMSYIQEQAQEKYAEDIMVTHINYADKFSMDEFTPIEAEVKDLRSKLSRIGEVNLSAITDYEDVSTRYKFLSEQQDDLLKAKDQLKKVIERINRICSRRFKETFEAVNERFMKVFPVLFGGGEARLILIEGTEEDQEPGIDIISKPPGKKMQNVSLLSGGEKALTAVSLIFSIFLVKPSPFCLLDEVDAPLDDANVFRFNDLVKEMAKRSQIIIVTHNKNTMAVNDKLYGVTMQEKGVSKMVSVDLEGRGTERVAHA